MPGRRGFEKERAMLILTGEERGMAIVALVVVVWISWFLLILWMRKHKKISSTPINPWTGLSMGPNGLDSGGHPYGSSQHIGFGSSDYGRGLVLSPRVRDEDEDEDEDDYSWRGRI